MTATLTPTTTNEPTADQLAEVAVLGAALWSPEAARGVAEHLEPGHFTREAHRIVFEAVAALVADAEPVDPVSVTLRLADENTLDQAGGPAAIYELSTLEACPTPAAWKVYARTVWKEADRRQQVREHLEALRDLGVEVGS